MAIQILCPGCKTRFKVSDQFAGKKGPCPKCKTVIQIPAKGEEVVIHGAPGAAVEGGKPGVGGGARAIPQPIFREDKGVSPVAIAVGVGSFLAIAVGAVAMRMLLLDPDQVDAVGRPVGYVYPIWAMALGAFLVAIPTSYYGFRAVETADIEKMPVQEALVRSLIAAACFAVLWGLVFLFKRYVFEREQLELYEVFIYAPVTIAIAGVIGMASFNLDYVRGLLHGGFYIGLCVALRLALGLGPF